MSRPKTGLARPNMMPVGLNDTERELLARDAFDKNQTRAETLRRGYFRPGWAQRLETLREKQRAIPLDKILNV